MNLDYTPFDLRVWLIFAAFVIATFVIVKIYHHRHPDYPEGLSESTQSEA